MPVLTCKWCGNQYLAVNSLENTCSTSCAKLWRRESDRMRRAVSRGEDYDLPRDGLGRVIRKCKSCSTRLSSFNPGEFCHPCWDSVPLTERGRVGYKSDIYNVKSDLAREREEIDANESGDNEESGDTPTGIDGGAGGFS